MRCGGGAGAGFENAGRSIFGNPSVAAWLLSVCQVLAKCFSNRSDLYCKWLDIQKINKQINIKSARIKGYTCTKVELEGGVGVDSLWIVRKVSKFKNGS